MWLDCTGLLLPYIQQSSDDSVKQQTALKSRFHYVKGGRLRFSDLVNTAIDVIVVTYLRGKYNGKSRFLFVRHHLNACAVYF